MVERRAGFGAAIQRAAQHLDAFAHAAQSVAFAVGSCRNRRREFRGGKSHSAAPGACGKCVPAHGGPRWLRLRAPPATARFPARREVSLWSQHRIARSGRRSPAWSSPAPVPPPALGSDIREWHRAHPTSACREICSTSRISFPARCGSRSINLPASSDFSVMTDSVCPSTSCRSRAMRSRSATLARFSISSFALRNLRFMRLRSAKKIFPAPMITGKTAE